MYLVWCAMRRQRGTGSRRSPQLHCFVCQLVLGVSVGASTGLGAAGFGLGAARVLSTATAWWLVHSAVRVFLAWLGFVWLGGGTAST